MEKHFNLNKPQPSRGEVGTWSVQGFRVVSDIYNFISMPIFDALETWTQVNTEVVAPLSATQAWYKSAHYKVGWYEG